MFYSPTAVAGAGGGGGSGRHQPTSVVVGSGKHKSHSREHISIFPSGVMCFITVYLCFRLCKSAEKL